VTTPADQLDNTLLPTDLQQFIHLANNVFELLKTAKRELERDGEAAKASLATASFILRLEIERRSRAKSARPGALAAWQFTRVRSFIDENLHHHAHQGPQRRSAAKHITFLAVLQTGLRRTTARLPGEETAGEGLSSDDHKLGIAERNSRKRRLLRSNTSVQAFQAGVWSMSIQLEART